MTSIAMGPRYRLPRPGWCGLSGESFSSTKFRPERSDLAWRNRIVGMLVLLSAESPRVTPERADVIVSGASGPYFTDYPQARTRGDRLFIVLSELWLRSAIYASIITRR
jgi:hypothetical protein